MMLQSWLAARLAEKKRLVQARSIQEPKLRWSLVQYSRAPQAKTQAQSTRVQMVLQSWLAEKRHRLRCRCRSRSICHRCSK